MILICKGKYVDTGKKLSFDPGRIEVDQHIGEYLLRDAPENFEQVSAETKELDAPTKDKAIHAPARKK